MDLNVEQHLPDNFSPSSRVWIYQSSRVFLISEALEIEEILNEFITGWTSHGSAVKGFANLFFGRFIVLMADEKETMVGGCSTDSSVRLIKEIEKKFQVDLFDRQQLAFIVKDKIEVLPLQQFSYAVENNFLVASDLYFNNLVATKQELQTKWIIPIGESWLSGRLRETAA